MTTGKYYIRMIDRNEWKDAMALCWRVFLEFEADLYPPEGSQNFHQFVTDDLLYQAYLNGGYPVCAAFLRRPESDPLHPCGDEMIGVAAIRSGPHLSLLFVEGLYQGRGVGRALVNYMREYLLKNYTGLGDQKMTVNASPVGLGFYRHLGFKDTGEEQTKDGILYTPMEFWM